MAPIEIIYLITSTGSLLMTVPQIRQLIVTKQSDELNIGTWTMWLVSQSVFFAYVVSKNDTVLMIMQFIWTLLYLAMVCLIVYYRWRPGGATPEQAPVLDQEQA
jgi:uncharacterized protein with PQ loop repeat